MIKKLLLVVMFLLPISIISFVVKYKTIFLEDKKPGDTPLIKISLTDLNITLDLNEYIIGVVAGEMPALFEEEALKAQAVASRSYALSSVKNNFVKISASINDQIYITTEEMQNKWGTDFNKYYNKISKCVLETENLVIKRDEQILKTYYFAMSNGYTENSQAVFGESGFLSVESKWDNETLNNFVVQKEFKESDLIKVLNLTASEIVIGHIEKNNTNHVDKLMVNNIFFTGTEFRRLLNLRSTDFTISKTESGFLITTKGYGHGVGMSQYGANGMAKDGYNFQEILEYYYDNIKIEKI